MESASTAKLAAADAKFENKLAQSRAENAAIRMLVRHLVSFLCVGDAYSLIFVCWWCIWSHFCVLVRNILSFLCAGGEYGLMFVCWWCAILDCCCQCTMCYLKWWCICCIYSLFCPDTCIHPHSKRFLFRNFLFFGLFCTGEARADSRWASAGVSLSQFIQTLKYCHLVPVAIAFCLDCCYIGGPSVRNTYCSEGWDDVSKIFGGSSSYILEFYWTRARPFHNSKALDQ